MKTFLLLCSALTITAVNAQTSGYLDINQVKARVNSGNDLHWDPTGGFGGYEAPAGSNKFYGGPASLWIGGLDAGGQLKLSAQTYHQSGLDYWAGPLDVTTATTNSATVSQYNRVWKLNQADIDAFVANYANGNVQNGSYTPVADLLSWPGNGNMAQNHDPLLAPFVDVNSDMVYDPLGSGDYPLIKGDQAIFTVFNDAYLPHGSGGAPIGVEVRLMAYAYGTGTMVANNPYLNYTTFYNYTIINRSAFTLNNVYTGLFNDSDIGTYADDYVGCSATKAYGYTYNNPAANTNDPAIGIAQTRGPINSTNGIDDDGDGTVDELWEEMSMTNFMYFNNSLPGVPVQTTDPANATEYFQYMTSFWKDGSPLTCGGNGYGGSLPINYAYPKDTYTTGPCGTAPWSEGDAGSDKKFVMSSGPFTLAPGAVHIVEYAFIASFDSINHDPIGNLDNAVNALRLGNTTTGITKNKTSTQFNLFPNPAHNQLNIESSQATNEKLDIEVTDVFGKIVLSESYKNSNKASVNITDLTPGIYFAKITGDKGQSIKKFIKQ
jgi:hypothetical protein